MNEQYVVIMFEPSKPGENLKLSEQVNEVFGLFKSEDQAEEWTIKSTELIKDREWLIIPLSNPTILNMINPSIN